jgi:hypothetical protein
LTTNPRTLFGKVANTSKNIDIEGKLLDTLASVNSTVHLEDFYLVGLWSYCEGKITNGVETITYCSAPKTKFWFDPTKLWNLEDTPMQSVLGHGLQKALDAYEWVAGWMNSAFIIATVLTAAEFVAGLFAISSRGGSLITLILSAVSLYIIFQILLISTNCP